MGWSNCGHIVYSFLSAIRRLIHLFKQSVCIENQCFIVLPEEYFLVTLLIWKHLYLFTVGTHFLSFVIKSGWKRVRNLLIPAADITTKLYLNSYVVKEDPVLRRGDTVSYTHLDVYKRQRFTLQQLLGPN